MSLKTNIIRRKKQTPLLTPEELLSAKVYTDTKVNDLNLQATYTKIEGFGITITLSKRVLV